MNLRILKTSDGSHTIFDSDFNETYHSIHGAIQEAQIVFLDAAFSFQLQQRKQLSILDKL